MDLLQWASTARACSRSLPPAQRALAHFIEHRLPSFGRYEDAIMGQDWAMALATVGAAESRCAASPRRRRGRQNRPTGASTPNCPRWKVHPPDPRLARIHVAPVLALRSRLHGQQRTECDCATCRIGGPAWTPPRCAECLHHALAGVRDRGWAHHIQRLMVLGNHAPAAGVSARRADRVVRHRLRRRLPLGDADQRHRHEPASPTAACSPPSPTRRAAPTSTR